jgi:hypothetical protein
MVSGKDALLAFARVAGVRSAPYHRHPQARLARRLTKDACQRLPPALVTLPILPVNALHAILFHPFTMMILTLAELDNDFSLVAGRRWSSEALERNHDAQSPRLKFDRVEMSTKLSDIVEQLKPICAMVSTALNLELLASSRTPSKKTATNRAQTTPEIVEPKLYGRYSQKNIVVMKLLMVNVLHLPCFLLLAQVVLARQHSYNTYMIR